MVQQVQESNQNVAGPASVGSAGPVTPARTLAEEDSNSATLTGLGVAGAGAGGLLLLRRRRHSGRV